MRGPDWILLLGCAALALAGPLMALQELAMASDARALEALTRNPTNLEPAFRAAWRTFLFVVVLIVGVVGTLVAVRVSRKPRVRNVSGRLLALLLGGMTLLDLAFLADGRWFQLADYTVRAASIVWLYPISAILMGGAALRLAEVEEAFSHADAEKPLLRRV